MDSCVQLMPCPPLAPALVAVLHNLVRRSRGTPCFGAKTPKAPAPPPQPPGGPPPPTPPNSELRQVQILPPFGCARETQRPECSRARLWPILWITLPVVVCRTSVWDVAPKSQNRLKTASNCVMPSPPKGGRGKRFYSAVVRRAVIPTPAADNSSGPGQAAWVVVRLGSSQSQSKLMRPPEGCTVLASSRMGGGGRPEAVVG